MIDLTIDITDTSADALQLISRKLADKASLHARMAAETEKFIKTRGRGTAPNEHRSANRLGATPTGHLEKAYRDVYADSNESGASLFVPRSTRLRAAFGAYVAVPGAGKTYLTIPVAAAAYGKRAGEIPGLQFMRVGPKKTPILAMDDGKGRITTYFILVKKVNVKEDAKLIPFEEIYQTAAEAAELYLLDESPI